LFDYSDFLGVIKKAAVEAVGASKPFLLTYGMVTSASPLEVRIDQKLTLAASQLLLTNAVRDYYVDMTVSHVTEPALDNVSFAHSHGYRGTTEQEGDHEHAGSYLPETAVIVTPDGEHAHTYPNGEVDPSSAGEDASETIHTHTYPAGAVSTEENHTHPGTAVPQTTLVIEPDGGHDHGYGGTTDSDGIFGDNHPGVTHTHGYVGRKKFLVHLGLKEGERVLLMRIQGGQQYIVLDRVVAPQ
jgi:hypothetical protein